MTVSDWIALGGFLSVIIGALIKVMVSMADIRARLTKIETEIGDRNSGMRGAMHDHADWLSSHNAVLYFVAKKLEINGDLMASLNKRRK